MYYICLHVSGTFLLFITFSCKCVHLYNFVLQVTYLLQASEDLFFRPEMARNDSHGIEENVVEFIGFLHPLNAKPLSERVKNLKLAICSAGSSALLKLSNDSTTHHLVCFLYFVFHYSRTLFL